MTLEPNDVAYTLGIILSIAFPGLEREFKIDAGKAAVHIQGRRIDFALTGPSDQKSLLAGTFPMRKIPSWDRALNLPVMLPNGRPFAEADDDALCLNADIITLPFFLMSRAEDVICSNRDQYGRMSYKDSLAAKYNFIDFPLVDEYALLLRREAEMFLPSLKVAPRKGRLILTHDVDTMKLFKNFKTAAKLILGHDVVLGKSLLTAVRSVGQYLKSLRDPRLDPDVFGLKALLDLSLKHNVTSEFYFMGYPPEHYDWQYDLQSIPVEWAMETIKKSGMIAGFHGGFGTHDDSTVFAGQKARVEEAWGEPAKCGRQHFLCFDALKSPRLWEENGMETDSTLGYYDREGFACGTAHPFPLYDLQRHSALNVAERPLIAMDCTLKNYRGMPRELALSQLRKLYARSMAAEGDLVILWHNRSIFRDWAPWFQDVYAEFLNAPDIQPNGVEAP